MTYKNKYILTNTDQQNNINIIFVGSVKLLINEINLFIIFVKLKNEKLQMNLSVNSYTDLNLNSYSY